MTAAAALRRCRQAYTDTYTAFAQVEASSGQVSNPDEVRALCSSAYKSAMPPLTDWHSIRAHIACVSQALVLDVVSERDAKTLMFIAQTALTTFAREKKTE